jgi:hypothetical protein
MINRYNPESNEMNVAEVIANFYTCIDDFINVMERENTCVKEHDTNRLIELLPLKKACSDRYEKIMNDIDQLISLKALSRDDLLNLYKTNNEFVLKSKENYAYLNNAHEYSQRLMNIFFATINQMNKCCYTDKGESKYSRLSQPVALSQTF